MEGTMDIATRVGIFGLAAIVAAALGVDASAAPAAPVYFDVSRGAHPHDVAATPAAGGPVYYTAQSTGKLGILDPKSGKFEEIALGARSAPHGVIVGPDGAAWITDGGHRSGHRKVRQYALRPRRGQRAPDADSHQTRRSHEERSENRSCRHFRVRRDGGAGR